MREQNEVMVRKKHAKSRQVSTTSELCQSAFYLEASLPEKQDSVFHRK